MKTVLMTTTKAAWRPRAIAPFLALALAAALSSRLVAQATAVKARSTLESVPAGTSLILRVANVAALKKKFESTPLYALKDNADIKKFLDEIQKEFTEGVADMRKNLGFDPADIMRSIEGEAVLAIGSLDKIIAAIAGEALGGGSGDVDPGDVPILLSLDAGGSLAKMKEYLGKIYEAAQKDGAEKKDEDFQSGKITTLTNTKQQGKNDLKRIFIGELGSTVLLSINRPYLEATMAGMGGSGGDSLAADADFKDSTGQLGESQDMLVFVNLKAVIEAARKNLQAHPIGGMVWNLVESKVLGRGLKNFSMGAGLSADNVNTSWFVNNGGSKEGIVGVFDGPGFAAKSPGGIIPPDVRSFSKTSINFSRLYGLIKDFANMAMSFTGQAGVDVEQFVELQFNVKLREVIDSLGQEVTGYTRESAETSPLTPLLGIGNLTIALELKSEEPIRNLINQLSILSGGAVQSEKYLDRDVFKLDPSSGDQSPVLALAQKLLVFGLMPSSAKELIRRQGKEEKSVADNPEFQALAAKLPEKVILVEYYSAAGVQQSFKALDVLQGQIPLPDFKIVGDVLAGGIGYALWQEKGLHGRSTMNFKKAK